MDLHSRFKTLSPLRWGLLLGFVILLISIHPHHFGSTAAKDYYQYWVASQSLSQTDITNIYSKYEQKDIKKYFSEMAQQSDSPSMKYGDNYWKGLQLNNTPLLYSFIFMISNGDFDADLRHFQIINLGFYFLALLIFCHLLNFDLLRTMSALVFFAYFFFPLNSDIEVGNVNQIQLGLLALTLLMLDQRNWFLHLEIGGFISAAAMAFKPNYAYGYFFLFLTYVIHKKWRDLKRIGRGLAAGALATWIFSYFVCGDKANWINWFSAMERVLQIREYFGRTFGSFVLSSRNFDTVKLFAFASFFAAFLFFIFEKKLKKLLFKETYPAWLHTFPAELFRNTGLGLAVFLLSGPMVHRHYFIGAIPLILFALRPHSEIKPADSLKIKFQHLIAIVGLAILAFHPYLKELDLAKQKNYSPWLYWGVIILAANSYLDPYFRKNKKMSSQN